MFIVFKVIFFYNSINIFILVDLIVYIIVLRNRKFSWWVMEWSYIVLVGGGRFRKMKNVYILEVVLWKRIVLFV